MITPQFVFMVMGIVLLVAAVILLIVSIVYYVRNDIRDVQYDLAGRTRRGGGSARDRGTAVRGRSVARGSRPSSSEMPRGAEMNAAADVVVQQGEDEVETVLDTKLRAVPQNNSDVNSDAYDINDDIPTLVTSVDHYDEGAVSEQKLNESDLPTLVDESEDDVRTQIEQVGEANASFVVTKSILAINSKEIITTD
ncbi:MAG: hypothetical protein IKF14_01490 [Atopobiaceae bacterium]|nr:hypothetical protein [Atopobiaceae bacterium]